MKRWPACAVPQGPTAVDPFTNVCVHVCVRTHAQGHEDLRQDERVMQLFGLVNNMLANDRATAERDLSIARYAGL